jgi:hypothetical protein
MHAVISLLVILSQRSCAAKDLSDPREAPRMPRHSARLDRILVQTNPLSGLAIDED